MLLRRNPSLSSRGLSSELNTADKNGRSVDASPRTVRRALVQMSFVNSLPATAPALSSVQKKARLQWCKDHRNENWNTGIFTDETSIELQHCKNRIWHKKGSRPVVHKSKHPSKLMFWSGISLKKNLPLTPVFGSINSDSYIRLLRDNLIPWLRKNRLSGMKLQQDNASVHVSRKTRDFFLEVKLHVLEWPANSPDLNPIENAWSYLKSRIESRFPKTL
jgi:hypothetical protein